MISKPLLVLNSIAVLVLIFASLPGIYAFCEQNVNSLSLSNAILKK